MVRQILLCTDLPMRKKITGLPKFRFLVNPLPTRFNNQISAYKQACIQRVCSTSREKRTNKHGISIVLKLVSIDYQKRNAGETGWEKSLDSIHEP